MTRKRVHPALALALAAILSSGVGLPAWAEPSDPPPSERHPDPIDCTGADPDVAPSLAPGSGHPLVLRVLVLADRVSIGRAREVMSEVVRGYQQIDIVLQVTYGTVELSGNDAVDMMQETRAHLSAAGVRGFDLVHVLSVAALEAGRTQVAGMARCAGGIRYSKHHLSLSISRANMPETGAIRVPVAGDMTVFTTRPAVTTAHELAHLLGATHAHGNCVENAQYAAASRQGSICTVMDTNLQWRQLRFGTLEKATVRAFALHYG